MESILRKNPVSPDADVESWVSIIVGYFSKNDRTDHLSNDPIYVSANTE
jgi:hypothetical protein